MKIVSAEEMRAIDRSTNERFGVPSLTLMENAGTAVADFVMTQYPDAKRVTVICGKGNNGGDGFVVARHLYGPPHDQGREVQVLLLANPEDLRGDAVAMFKKLPQPAVSITSADELQSERARGILDADLYIDAILGTGFKQPVSGLYAEAIKIMNESFRADGRSRHPLRRRRRRNQPPSRNHFPSRCYRYLHRPASCPRLQFVNQRPDNSCAHRFPA